jgi:hypothetical protein
MHQRDHHLDQLRRLKLFPTAKIPTRPLEHLLGAMDLVDPLGDFASCGDWQCTCNFGSPIKKMTPTYQERAAEIRLSLAGPCLQCYLQGKAEVIFCVHRGN